MKNREPMNEGFLERLGEFGIDPEQADLWMAVGSVPSEIREEYYAKAKAEDGDITTMGLLHYWEARRNG